KTIRTYDNQPVVYVDSVGLTIDYETIEPVVVEEVVDPPKIILKDSSIVLSGDSDYGAENPPVFIVKNPELTTEDVNQLIAEDKAEVVEDKEGVLAETIKEENTDPSVPSGLPSQSEVWPDMFDPFKDIINPVVNLDTTEEKNDQIIDQTQAEGAESEENKKEAPEETIILPEDEEKVEKIPDESVLPPTSFFKVKNLEAKKIKSFFGLFKAQKALADEPDPVTVSAVIL